MVGGVKRKVEDYFYLITLEKKLRYLIHAV